MELEQAKDAVIKASGQLVQLGLVARTWGNVSCRVGESHFLITPSGKPYEHLTREQLVLVDLADLSYQKGVKPSSEKKLHREVYKLKKDVSCVIHTHQEMASLAGLLGKDIPVSEHGRPLLGEIIAAARYGLPGTKTLVKNAKKAIVSANASTVLLANHGALCFGKDAIETLEIAKQLEAECRGHLSRLVPLFGEEGGERVKTQGDFPKEAVKLASFLKTKESLGRSVLFHNSPVVLALSNKVTSLPAYLDDFAQIAGTKIPVVLSEISGPALMKLSKRYNAILIKDVGALCWATTLSDAEAVAMILEKNCKAALLSLQDPAVKPISWLDTHLMRFVYQKKYAKIAQEQEL